MPIWKPRFEACVLKSTRKKRDTHNFVANKFSEKFDIFQYANRIPSISVLVTVAMNVNQKELYLEHSRIQFKGQITLYGLL